MVDMDYNQIEPGQILKHNYGIPPTTIELYVFGDHRAEYLHVIDSLGNISTLSAGIANNSIIIKKGE